MPPNEYKNLNPEKALIWRIVHRDNLPWILEHGLHFAWRSSEPYVPALEQTIRLIDGFESPFGLELLATLDWLITCEHVAVDVDAPSSKGCGSGLRGAVQNAKRVCLIGG